MAWERFERPRPASSAEPAGSYSCCPDPAAAPAAIGVFPFGVDQHRGTCAVCGRGKLRPHQDWCASVGASLHRANHHRLRIVPPALEHGTEACFLAGCRRLLCIRAYLEARPITSG